MLPQLYQAGIWAALVIGIGFTSVYAWRIASENARMAAGFAATQLALSREHRLASIGALATAAAHELGTPLGTDAATIDLGLDLAVTPQLLVSFGYDGNLSDRGQSHAVRGGLAWTF